MELRSEKVLLIKREETYSEVQCSDLTGPGQVAPPHPRMLENSRGVCLKFGLGPVAGIETSPSLEGMVLLREVF